MKIMAIKQIRSIVIIGIMSMGFQVFSQGPPNPPGEDGNTQNNRNGGGAPIGGGLFILIGLGAAYGGKKIYNLYQEGKESLEE